MSEIFDFAKNATPIALIALCLIIIIMLLLQGNSFISSIFKRQKLNTYKIEGGKATLDSVSRQLDIIAGNHLHELPEMNKNINAIQETVNKIQIKQNIDSERLAKVEGYLKINI